MVSTTGMVDGNVLTCGTTPHLVHWADSEVSMRWTRHSLVNWAAPIWLGLCVPATLTGCSAEDTELSDIGVGRARHALAQPGPWQIPADTLAIGDTMQIEYTGAGPWVGEAGCYPGMTPGNSLLRDYIYANFPQTYSIGGYACRHIVGNPNVMSVHATGRALDIMIHTIDEEADNDLGDAIGNWLIENAEYIGIQYIIWDLFTWGGHKPAGEKDNAYGGSHPHNDHLHVELSLEMSASTELWFLDDVTPPVIEGCAAIPIEGAVIDETDTCFRAFGPNEFWRYVDDAGHDDSLLWTNAFESDDPSNWARWNLVFEEDGSYGVEVYVDPAWGVHKDTRYLVHHAGGEELVAVDQSAQQGWVSLGEFEFDNEREAWVDVFDDMPGSVAADQHIVVDAVRLTGEGFDPPVFEPGDPGTDPTDPLEEESRASSSSDDGGCSVSRVGGDDPNSGWMFAVWGAGFVALRRRRRAAN
jgi:MYXO-CTERM domain-containing protein